MKTIRQSPSGPRRTFSIDVTFPPITWSGDINPFIPPSQPGRTGEGFCTKSSSIYVVGIDETYHVLSTLRATEDSGQFWLLALPFAFGSPIIIVPGAVQTLQGEAREVVASVSYLQDIAPGNSASTGPINLKLLFFKNDNTLIEGFI